MIHDYPSSKLPVWRLIAQEALALVATGVLYPFGIKASQRQTPRRRDQRTVVIIHGYLANSSELFPLIVYLRWRGFKQILSFNYDSGRGIESAAIALREFLRHRVRGGRIDLVCHSIGGLAARIYIQQLGGYRRVDRCVTLATPHRGTYNSYWLRSRVGEELRPDSPLLAQLQSSSAIAANVRFLSVIGGSDHIIVPRVFAHYEQAVHIPDLGHVSMLFSPRVFRLVADFLLDKDIPAS